VPFANLPHWTDGDVKITESHAILLAVARKYKPELLGKSLKEQTDCDQVLSVMQATLNTLGGVLLEADNPEAAIAAGKPLSQSLLMSLCKFKGSNKYLVGPNVTVADF
jgi:glutathione S-transferase